LKAINQAANQVKDDLAKVTKHCGCYVALAAEIALAIEAAESALAAAGGVAAAAWNEMKNAQLQCIQPIETSAEVRLRVTMIQRFMAEAAKEVCQRRNWIICEP